jgi:hypothetical protein
MANKKPRNFDLAANVTDNWEFYYQPSTGSEQKATATQMVTYLQGKGLADKSYLHTQGSVSSTWNIVHNLGKVPNVIARNASGQHIFGEVQVLSNNEINLLFNQAVSGTATCA